MSEVLNYCPVVVRLMYRCKCVGAHMLQYEIGGWLFARRSLITSMKSRDALRGAWCDGENSRTFIPADCAFLIRKVEIPPGFPLCTATPCALHPAQYAVVDHFVLPDYFDSNGPLRTIGIYVKKQFSAIHGDPTT
jgi:hypothetical protein